jgi:hypothetical protein
MKRLWPALIILVISLSYVAWRLVHYDGDPIAVAEIGTRYADLDPDGSEGYDGQFSTYIALDPDPTSVADHLDIPSYRYQRILYPLTARLLAFGNEQWIPWSLLLLNVAAHTAATYALSVLLSRKGIAPAYALIYGLWVGLFAGVGLNLHEPIAYGLVVFAFLLRDQKRYVPMAVALGLALFAKETTALFWLAVLVADLFDRQIDAGHAALIIAGTLFGAWQIWLWRIFGSPGVGSGGAMATPFEIIPLWGFFRIGFVSPRALVLYALIFGPTIILPTIYALFQGISRLRSDRQDANAWSSVFNAGVIVLLPFSTFREPLGLVRIFSGVVLGFVLLNAELGNRKVLNYAFFWGAMLALLVSQ